jgi:hypothetical protein
MPSMDLFKRLDSYGWTAYVRRVCTCSDAYSYNRRSLLSLNKEQPLVFPSFRGSLRVLFLIPLTMVFKKMKPLYPMEWTIAFAVVFDIGI